MTHSDLITLSADPRAADPSTIRQVLREAHLHLPQAAQDAEFFIDCITVRRLLAAGEVDRAALVAEQIGQSLADFAPVAPEATLLITKADGVALDLPAMQARYAAAPNREQLLRELRWHVALKCPSLSYEERLGQIRLAANAVILRGAGCPPTVAPVTRREVQRL